MNRLYIVFPARYAGNWFCGHRKLNQTENISRWLDFILPALIADKMALMGTNSLAAYPRKVAIDGYTVNLKLPELGKMMSLPCQFSSNLNQLTRRVHETGRFYDADLEELRQSYDRLWDAAQKFFPHWRKYNNHKSIPSKNWPISTPNIFRKASKSSTLILTTPHSICE